MIKRILDLVPAVRKERILSAVFWKALDRIKKGNLVVTYQGESRSFGQPEAEAELHARIDIHSKLALQRTVTSGTIGAGESYMKGEWTSPDLSNVIQLFFRNTAVLDGMEAGLAKASTYMFKILHWLKKNTISQARKNISDHYDLGNDFFELFLDPTMMYSSAIFDSENMSLEEASINKLDRICKKLKLNEKDHLVEIGTGWGGMAIHAAKNYGCRVTTTTISKEQLNLATERVEAAGLQDRIELLLKDYRDLTGQFDKLVSVEMIEAVGHQYLDTYFQKCSSLLKPDGLMLIQAINIKDQRYDYSRGKSDFIKKYIFPGGFLPSISVIADSVRKVTDLQMVHMEQFGRSYAKTLNQWKQNFFMNLRKIEKLGYPNSFLRMWEFYLSGCEGGFLEHVINVAQLVFEKPEHRQQALMGSM